MHNVYMTLNKGIICGCSFALPLHADTARCHSIRGPSRGSSSPLSQRGLDHSPARPN